MSQTNPPLSPSDASIIWNPILLIVQKSLEDAIRGLRMPPFPLKSPEDLQALLGEVQKGSSQHTLTDADAYILNCRQAVVWMQCMIGLDLMAGMRASLTSGSHLSSSVLARAAIETFALGFWVCDDRLSTVEQTYRALLLNRESVREEHKRAKRDMKVVPNQLHASFNSRLGMLDRAIKSYAERLRTDGVSFPAAVPTKTQAIRNILKDISPVSDGIYSKLSAVVHGDGVFVWDLFTDHLDSKTQRDFGDSSLRTMTITTYLIPVWHAVVAMGICVGVGAGVVDGQVDIKPATGLSGDIQGFIGHNGEEPIWYFGDTEVREDALHALNWYYEKKGLDPPQWT